MKYTAPKMEMNALEVEDIIMSNQGNDGKVEGDGTIGGLPEVEA